MAGSIRELSGQRIVRADRRGWVGAMGDRRPRLSLIGGGFSAAAARCADRTRSELEPYKRYSPSSAVSTHDSCRREALTHTIRRRGGVICQG